jgi:cytochrome c oxidase subunit 2
MKKNVLILEQDEYDTWLTTQKSYYLASIRGTENDPNGDILFPAEITQRRDLFNTEVNNALETPQDGDNTLVLNYVTFETGSDKLTEFSSYQLDDAIDFLKKNADVRSMLKGHTDNMGDADANLILSESRAAAVRNYLVSGGIAAARLTSTGFGSVMQVADNSTEEGRQANRRTELYVTRSELPAGESISK